MSIGSTLSSMKRDSNEPVSGYDVRLEAHLNALHRYWPKCVNDDEQASLLKWFLNGDLLGLEREELFELLSEHSEFQDVLSEMAANDPVGGQYPPEYRYGEHVEVIVNAKNLTHHVGTVRKAIWHSKDRRWNFYLEVGGKNIGKRYLAVDLRRT